MAAPRKDDVNKLIIEATRQLLQEKSLADISLAQIAEQVGISKGTLYYHYKTKEEILFAVMDTYLDEQWQNLQDWTSDASKDTSLPRLIKYILERDTSTADMRFHFFHEALSGNEQIRIRLLERYQKFASIIEEKIGERTNCLPPTYLSWLVLLLADGLLVQKLLQNPSLSTDDFIKETENYLRFFLSPKK